MCKVWLALLLFIIQLFQFNSSYAVSGKAHECARLLEDACAGVACLNYSNTSPRSRIEAIEHLADVLSKRFLIRSSNVSGGESWTYSDYVNHALKSREGEIQNLNLSSDEQLYLISLLFHEAPKSLLPKSEAGLFIPKNLKEPQLLSYEAAEQAAIAVKKITPVFGVGKFKNFYPVYRPGNQDAEISEIVVESKDGVLSEKIKIPTDQAIVSVKSVLQIPGFEHLLCIGEMADKSYSLFLLNSDLKTPPMKIFTSVSMNFYGSKEAGWVLHAHSGYYAPIPTFHGGIKLVSLMSEDHAVNDNPYYTYNYLPKGVLRANVPKFPAKLVAWSSPELGELYFLNPEMVIKKIAMPFKGERNDFRLFALDEETIIVAHKIRYQPKNAFSSPMMDDIFKTELALFDLSSGRVEKLNIPLGSPFENLFLKKVLYTSNPDLFYFQFDVKNQKNGFVTSFRWMTYNKKSNELEVLISSAGEEFFSLDQYHSRTLIYGYTSRGTEVNQNATAHIVDSSGMEADRVKITKEGIKPLVDGFFLTADGIEYFPMGSAELVPLIEGRFSRANILELDNQKYIFIAQIDSPQSREVIYFYDAADTRSFPVQIALGLAGGSKVISQKEVQSLRGSNRLVYLKRVTENEKTNTKDTQHLIWSVKVDSKKPALNVLVDFTETNQTAENSTTAFQFIKNTSYYYTLSLGKATFYKATENHVREVSLPGMLLGVYVYDVQTVLFEKTVKVSLFTNKGVFVYAFPDL